jgi:hypothetical protein
VVFRIHRRRYVPEHHGDALGLAGSTSPYIVVSTTSRRG